MEENNRKVVLFFFIGLFVTGLFIFKDFGISWDEQYQWKSNGNVNYNFIVHGDKQTLLNGADKYHGPAFELVLTLTEKAFRLSDTRQIFLMRHVFTFLVFYISALFFYFLALKIFKNWKIALPGFFFYVLSPHIFSHAFYNSKDPVFLAFFTISMYCMFLFLEKRTYKHAAVFAIVTAFTIDVRVVGVLIPGIFLYLFFIEIIKTKQLKIPEGNNKLFPLVFFFVIMIPCIILFWPVLWLDPLFHFKQALIENSRYPFDAPVLYFGKEYTPVTLPWHYIFFWMFISRPVIYSVFFIAGIFVLLRRFIKMPFRFLLENDYEQAVIGWFFLPLLAMFIFNSPVFDTGRHLYFLHGGFVLLSLYGLQAIWNLIKEKKMLIYIFASAIFLSFAGVVFKMISLHPYEHLYFNEVGSNDLEARKNKFELDYWGLAARQTLELILEKDTSALITIDAENLPGQLNTYLLKPAERSRIRCEKGLKNAQYFLADYRWKKAADYPYKEEACSVIIGNTKLSTLFKTGATK